MNILTEFKQEVREVVTGYYFVTTSIPVGFSNNETVRNGYSDRWLSIPNTNGSIWMKTLIEVSGIYERVADGTFAADSEAVRCESIGVYPGHTRKGIASAMYYLASFLFDGKVLPSELLTEDGSLFWRGRSSIHWMNEQFTNSANSGCVENDRLQEGSAHNRDFSEEAH